jgi:serine/threonine protein kinase
MARLQDRQRDVVGPYTVERELGRGSAATVYLARDAKHGRAVALKVLHPEFAAALGAERFQREIRLLARLQHPHILPLYDSGEADGTLYYVMPYVEGESLGERLKRVGRLPVAETVRIGRELLGALAYAHAHDVVHRDIKPENVLLVAGQPVLADFGVARAIGRASGATHRLTDAGVVVGTPAYMSPEQASADPVLDGRSDLYSLGCVMYEMLTGRAPWAGSSAHKVIARRFIEQPVPLGKLRSEVPRDVESAVMRALCASPDDRWPSAEAFAAALAGAAATTPVDGPDGEPAAEPARRAGLWASLTPRQRIAAAGILAAAALLALLFSARSLL